MRMKLALHGLALASAFCKATIVDELDKVKSEVTKYLDDSGLGPNGRWELSDYLLQYIQEAKAAMKMREPFHPLYLASNPQSVLRLLEYRDMMTKDPAAFEPFVRPDFVKETGTINQESNRAAAMAAELSAHFLGIDKRPAWGGLKMSDSMMEFLERLNTVVVAQSPDTWPKDWFGVALVRIMSRNTSELWNRVRMAIDAGYQTHAGSHWVLIDTRGGTLKKAKEMVEKYQQGVAKSPFDGELHA